MNYLTNGLSFRTLRAANLKRLPQFKNNKGEPAHTKEDGSDWSVSDWVECVTGELGEFANLHKKFRRGDISQEEFDKEGRKEIADIQIYLDILAYRLDIKLEDAVVEKFNETSDKVGSNIILGSDDDWHYKKQQP